MTRSFPVQRLAGLRRTGLRAAAPAVALLLLAAAGALAQPQWTRPAAVARAECNYAPYGPIAAAGNQRGDLLVAWFKRPCRSLRGELLVSTRPAGGRFSRPRVLDRPRSLTTGKPLDAVLDARGGATVVWTRDDGGYPIRSRLLAATRPPGRAFEPRQLLDPDGKAPALAGNERGDAAIVWQHAEPAGNPTWTGDVRAAARSVGETLFGARQQLSEPLAEPRGRYATFRAEARAAVSLGPDGHATAAWTRTDGSAPRCCTAVEAAVRAPGAAFALPERVSEPIADAPWITSATATAANGAGTIAWTQQSETDAPDGVFAARWDGAGFTPSVLLRAGVRPPSYIDLQAQPAPDGTTTVGWTEHFSICSPPPPRYAVTVPPAGAPAPARSITPDLYVSGQLASLAPDGRLFTVWAQASRVVQDRYNRCWWPDPRVVGAYDGGPAVTGPALDLGSGLVLAGGPAAVPSVLWVDKRTLLVSSLRDAP